MWVEADGVSIFNRFKKSLQNPPVLEAARKKHSYFRRNMKGNFRAGAFCRDFLYEVADGNTVFGQRVAIVK